MTFKELMEIQNKINMLTARIRNQEDHLRRTNSSRHYEELSAHINDLKAERKALEDREIL